VVKQSCPWRDYKSESDFFACARWMRASGSVSDQPSSFSACWSGERQADDVEVAALDARNEAACAALDPIGAGFVVLFPGRQVARDLFRESTLNVTKVDSAKVTRSASADG